MRLAGSRQDALGGKRSVSVREGIAGSISRMAILLALSAITITCGTLEVSSGNPPSESAEYRKASSANTVKAYADFIEKHPNSDLVENAKAAMETLAYQNAVALGTIDAFEGYLHDYPTGRNAWNAQGTLEDLYFRWARETDTEESWSVFLSRFPYGYNTSAALLRLAEIRFARAKKVNTILGYAEFSKNNKPYFFYEADEAAYAVAQKQSTIDSFKEYLQSFPNGFYSYQAEQQIGKINQRRIDLLRRKYTILQPN